MTEEEVKEGLENLLWLRNNGHKLIEAMLNPTRPTNKREVEKNGK